MNRFIRTAAEINLATAEGNYRALEQTLLPCCRMMAVVKANAYGHGAVRLGKLYERLGAAYLGVACISEAVELRAAGIALPLLVLGPTMPENIDTLAQYDITTTVYSAEHLVELIEGAKNKKLAVKVHIKMDSGMGRIGFSAQELLEGGILERIQAAEGSGLLHINGIFSHFAAADEKEEKMAAYTVEQLTLFQKVAAHVEKMLGRRLIKHIANSGGTLHYPQAAMDMVRVGISLYLPTPELPTPLAGRIQPVIAVKTMVEMVKTLPTGIPLGYGITYTTSRPTKIATVCIGYADGFPRSFSNCGYMLLQGVRVPVIGRVCMDQLMLDVTALPQVVPGEVVTVIGRSGREEITFHDWAAHENTIAYELLCRIAPRVERIYYEPL